MENLNYFESRRTCIFIYLIFTILFSFSNISSDITINQPNHYTRTIRQGELVPHFTFCSQDYSFHEDANGRREVLYDKRRQLSHNREEVTVRLHFEGSHYPSFIIMNEDFIIDSFDCEWISYNLADITIPNGIYNLYTNFCNDQTYYLVIQNLNVLNCSNSNYIHRYVYMDNANLHIELNSCDKNSNLLFPNERYIANFMYYFSELPFYWSMSALNNFMMVSEMDSSVEIIISELQYTADDVHITQYGPFAGINSNLTLSNQAEDFVSQTIQMKIPENTLEPVIAICDESWFFFSDYLCYSGWLFLDEILNFQEDQFEIDLHMMEHQFNDCGFTTSFFMGEMDDIYFSSTYSTPPFHCREDKIGGFWNIPYHEYNYLSPSGNILQYGNYPTYNLVYYDMQNAELLLNSFSMGYNNDNQDHNFFDDYYLLSNSSGNIVCEGLIEEVYGTYLLPDIYTFEIIDDDLCIADLSGIAHLKSVFDSTENYGNPPSISSFTIRNETGVPCHRLEFGESANLHISAFDVEYYGFLCEYHPVVTGETEMYYKLHEDEYWLPLAWEYLTEYPNFNWNNGKFFSADLSSLTQVDSVAYDLKFYFEDEDTNSCEWTLSPAFVVGDFSGVDAEQEEIPIPSLQILNLSTYPNPFNPSTTISFNLSDEQNVPIELSIYNLKGQKVKNLSPSLHSPSSRAESRSEVHGKNKLEVVWNGTDDSGKPVSSGIYFCKLKSGNFEKTKKMLLMK